MAYKDLKPLTNEEGDVRELTEEDMSWFVAVSDFPDQGSAHQFLRDRSAFFRDAEELGFEREAFLPFSPSKPGFVERASAAVMALSQHPKHAAE
jgi:hypothetical protein